MVNNYSHVFLKFINYLVKIISVKTTLPVPVPVPINSIPIRILRPDHTLSRSKISPAALTVLYQLHKAGYQAFLVGGGVRDVLLGRAPKDFDVVTNALPDQIKHLFSRQCRLIGRRFVLAHVSVNRDVVEVSTFRAHHEKGGDGAMENGRIVRDNVYGSSINEDVWRRDFTVNALYYDISDFSVIDYTNGMTDLRAGVLRLIGEPILRYQEDPVRMLRAARFAAKLGFKLDPATAEPIPQLGNLLTHIPPARLHEEALKLFLSGYAMESFKQLRKYDLFKHLFPYTEASFQTDPLAQPLVEQILFNTDQRLAKNKPVAAAFLLAALLWPPLLQVLSQRPFHEDRQPEDRQQELMLEAIQHLMVQQMRYVFIPKRIIALIQDIWLFQLRLTGKHRGKKSLRLMEHPCFRAGYDFLMLRAQVDESLQKYSDWWTQLQEGDSEVRLQLMSHGGHPFLPERKRRARKSSKSKIATAKENTEDGNDEGI